MKMKMCSKTSGCGMSLNVSEFGKDMSQRDNLKRVCKSCTRKYSSICYNKKKALKSKKLEKTQIGKSLGLLKTQRNFRILDMDFKECGTIYTDSKKTTGLKYDKLRFKLDKETYEHTEPAVYIFLKIHADASTTIENIGSTTKNMKNRFKNYVGDSNTRIDGKLKGRNKLLHTHADGCVIFYHIPKPMDYSGKKMDVSTSIEKLLIAECNPTINY